MTQTGHKAEMPQGCGGLTRKKTPLFRFLKPDPEIQMKAFYCSFWQQQQPKKTSCAFLCGWIIHRVFIYLFIFSISSLFDKLPKPRGLAEPSCRAERLDALFWRVLVSCSPDSFVSDKCIWLGTGQPLHLHSTADEGWSERHQTQICMFCVQTECTHGSVPSSHWRPRLSEFDSDLLDAAEGQSDTSEDGCSPRWRVKQWCCHSWFISSARLASLAALILLSIASVALSQCVGVYRFISVWDPLPVLRLVSS